MGNVKMQKVDLCVIQDNELAQVFLKTEKKPAVATVVVVDQTVPPNSPEVSGLHKALRVKGRKGKHSILLWKRNVRKASCRWSFKNQVRELSPVIRQREQPAPSALRSPAQIRHS